MGEKPVYTAEDCSQTGPDSFLSGRVIVVKPEALPAEQRGAGQLLFCVNGADGVPDPESWTVSAVSLADGEYIQKKRGELLGPLKPELLPERARLQLSQIRPPDTEAPQTPEFTGYCFLPDGRYAAGVPLADEMEVRKYIDIQRAYQHRLMICDSEDCCVFEAVEGKVIFPTPEMRERFLREDLGLEEPDTGGMKLQP